MNVKGLLVLVVFVAAALVSLPARAEGIKTGKWEVTMVTKVEGMPDMAAMMDKMPPGVKLPAGMSMSGGPGGMTIKSTNCVTQANPVPGMKTPPGCEAPEFHQNGNTVDYSMTCKKGTARTSISGHVTYTDGSMQGSTKTTQVMDGREIHSTSEMTGRYLGPC
ncbi:MAG: DUF3617 family protein [Candidatus Omnitrophota bacterium]